jgi:chemotaxis signal transduction protein
MVCDGDIALELSIGALGWSAIEPAAELEGPPPEVEEPSGRELLFERGSRSYAIPIELLEYVVEGPRVFPVPLAPSAHRGLLYHGRAIHSVFDVAALYGHHLPDGGHFALLVEAGGNAIALLADRVLPTGGAARGEVSRPSWDLLLAGA